MSVNHLFERTDDPQMRAFLDLVGPKWYIETAPDGDGECQGGTVDKVFRDKYGIAVCFRVKLDEPYGRKKYDYISADRVSFFEPYDLWVSSFEDYDDTCTFEWINNYLAEQGYVYIEDECVWRHPETGEEYCY